MLELAKCLVKLDATMCSDHFAQNMWVISGDNLQGLTSDVSFFERKYLWVEYRIPRLRG